MLEASGIGEKKKDMSDTLSWSIIKIKEDTIHEKHSEKEKNTKT